MTRRRPCRRKPAGLVSAVYAKVTGSNASLTSNSAATIFNLDRDRIYDWIATNQYKWLGKRPALRSPPQGDARGVVEEDQG
jgi:predicted DCC family thiol-disulfide oxidoreductase YuxK